MTTPPDAGRSIMPSAFAALHADATRLIEAWSAPDARLAQVRERFLQVLRTDPMAVWRDGPPVHLTASLVLLSPDLDAVALTLHRKAKRWFQFGGHVEAGDASMADAALREGREESGLDGLRLLPGLLQLDAHPLPSAFGRCREHLDVRFAAVAETAALTCSDESDEVRWWPLDALPADLESALHDAISLAVERARTAASPATATASTGDPSNTPPSNTPQVNNAQSMSTSSSASSSLR